MKKLLFTLILSVVMISIQSCTTTYAAVYDQYDEEYVISDNADVNIIITYGTPYYYEGKLWYYLYNGLYYYPFHHNGYWYFRPYGTLYSWDWYHYHYCHFTPNYRDYRFRPHHKDWNRPHHKDWNRPHHKDWNRPHHDGRRPGGHGKVHQDRPKGHHPNIGHSSHKLNNGGGDIRHNGNNHRHNQNGKAIMNNGRPSSRPNNGRGSTIKPSRSHRPSSGSGMSRPSSGRRR